MNAVRGKTLNTSTKSALTNGRSEKPRPLLRIVNDNAADVEYPDGSDSLSDEILEPDPGRNLLDRSVQIYPSDAVKRYSIGCNSFVAETIYAPAASKVYVRYRASVHLLVLYEEGARRRGETSIRGLSASTLRAFSKKLTFVPAGLCFREWQETNTSIRITYLYLDPAKLDEFADAAANYAPRFEDAVLWETAAKLRSAIENNQEKSKTYLEAIANVLAHELSGSKAASDQTSHANRGGLAGWQMRAVASHIDEHLDQQISLPTLARLVRLSTYHFCRAFKQSFNTSPHRYHVQRRVEQTKVLLSNRRISITEVGLSVGYPYPGSFFIAFRKITGQTPSEFRRSIALSANDED